MIITDYDLYEVPPRWLFLRVETSDGTVGLFGLTDPATHSLNPHAAALSFTDELNRATRR